MKPHRVRLPFVVSAQVSSNRTVEMVFDGIVGTTRKKFRNLGPAVAVDLLGIKNDSFFLLRPRLFLDAGI